MPLPPAFPGRLAATDLLLSAAPALQAQFAVSRRIGRPTRPDPPAASSAALVPDGTQSGAADRYLMVADSTLEDDGTRTHRIVTAYPVR
jgi:hypothetical protein